MATSGRAPSRRDLLETLAELESFDATLSRYPGLSRAGLLEILGLPTAQPASGSATAKADQDRLIIHTDGASRGNPGPASIGATLDAPDGRRVSEVSECIGVQTNNYAEYMAVLVALERARELGAQSVHVRADSQLVVRQLEGAYRVKNEGLRPIYEKVKRIERSFPGGVSYEHVRRELNQAADALANEALDLT